MTLTEIKSNLHNLIDELENPALLNEFYNEIKYIVDSSKHSIWDTLTEAEKKDVLLSYEESEIEENLIDNDEVMKKYRKWL